jgi:hypothetical protein
MSPDEKVADAVIVEMAAEVPGGRHWSHRIDSRAHVQVQQFIIHLEKK